MRHEIPWDKTIIDNFIKYGNLNQEQIKIMQLRTTDHSDYEIAGALNIGTTTYYRRLEQLKRIYDKVVFEHPELNMPKRNVLNSKLFAFKTKENALDFINRLTFEGVIVEMKIIHTKK